MLQQTDEHEIIHRAQDGDKEAFESLIILYSPTLFRVVKRTVPLNTIRTHLHRAKILLKRQIEKKNG